MRQLAFYLSEKFLDEFIEKRPSSVLSNDYIAWVRLYQFLSTSYPEIILHDDVAYLSKWIDNDGLVRNIVDKFLQGNSNIKFNEWETYEQSSPFSFYLLHSSKVELKNKLLRRGLPTFENENSVCLEQITGYKAIPVHSGQIGKLKNWKDLQNHILPFHSIAIVDNYLLQNVNSVVDFLKGLFSSLTLSSAPVDIVLIGSTTESMQKKNELSQDYLSRIDTSLRKTKENIRKIKQNLDAIYKNPQAFKYNFVILENTSQFHDRLIFTNGQFITSGNSFGNYFDINGQVKMKSPTILNVYSYACTQNSTPWSEIAFTIIQTLKETIQKLPSDYVVGKPLNNSLFLDS